MSTNKTRLDLIIDAVIKKVGLRSWMELADARQTLLVEAHEAWTSPEEQPDALVYCILYRRAVDAIRHQQRYFPRDLASYEEEPAWSDAVASLGPEAPATAEQQAAALEVLALIEAPGVLSPREHTFIHARFVAGETHAEIAERAGVSRTRVQQVVEQAVAKLRRRI